MLPPGFNLILISGGIGSGKSVVSEILRIKGFPVFDCDAEAKRLMDADPEIHLALCRHIHPDAVSCGSINRQLISQIVFSDARVLTRLNDIVHSALRRRLLAWVGEYHGRGHHLAFVESAIPYTGGLTPYILYEWRVTAPLDVRVKRVMRRSALSRDAVIARIEAQHAEYPAQPAHHVEIIDNSGLTPLLPRLNQLIATPAR